MIRTLLRWVIAGLSLLAGLSKLSNPPQFAREIANYGLTSSSVAVLLAVYLPWLEIVAAICLLTRRLERGALGVLGGLLLVFIGALSSAWARGLDIACGCFRAENTPTQANFPLLLLRDGLLLIVVSALLSAACREKVSKSRSIH